MGLYDQAVASNQNIWQQRLQQPSAVNRFMESLRRGQQGLAMQKSKQEAMAQQEALNQSLIEQRRQQAEQQQAEFAMRQANAPLEARSKETDIAYKEGLLKQMLAPKPAAPGDIIYDENRLAWERGPEGLKALLDPSGRQIRKYVEPKASGGGGMGKAPAGYRWSADGNLEPIPGGPAAGKADIESQKTGSAIAGMDSTIQYAQQLLDHPGRKGATGTWNYSRLAPGTDAYDFAALTETLKSKLFLPQVQSLRGMGALSDAEGKKLTDAVAALDFRMSEQAFADQLRVVINEMQAAKMRLQGGAMINPQNVESRVSPSGGQAIRPRSGVQTTVKDGKTYYMWPDGNWHTKAPQ